MNHTPEQLSWLAGLYVFEHASPRFAAGSPPSLAFGQACPRLAPLHDNTGAHAEHGRFPVISGTLSGHPAMYHGNMMPRRQELRRTLLARWTDHRYETAFIDCKSVGSGAYGNGAGLAAGGQAQACPTIGQAWRRVSGNFVWRPAGWRTRA